MSRARGRAAVLGALATAALLVAVPSAEGADRPRQELAFQDPAIDESSGLVVRGDDVLTVNDSGGEPVVHVVDASSGETVGRTTYAPGTVDVEALAEGRDGEVWVGDIGDNGRVRAEVSLYRIGSVSRGDRTVEATRYDLAYPDGPRDAEALLVHPRTGQVFVVTKGTFGGEVFAAPQPLRTDATNRLRPVGTTGGLVTDGTFLADGRSVVLRDYRDGVVLDPATWTERGSFPLPRQQQGEGLAPWPSAGGGGTRVLVSSEGANTPLWSVPVPSRLVVEQASPGRPEADGPPAGRDTTAEPEDEGSRSQAGDGGPARESSPIPLGPAAAGGAVLVAATLLGFWLLRRRVRR